LSCANHDSNECTNGQKGTVKTPDDGQRNKSRSRSLHLLSVATAEVADIVSVADSVGRVVASQVSAGLLSIGEILRAGDIGEVRELVNESLSAFGGDTPEDTAEINDMGAVSRVDEGVGIGWAVVGVAMNAVVTRVEVTLKSLEVAGGRLVSSVCANSEPGDVAVSTSVAVEAVEAITAISGSLSVGSQDLSSLAGLAVLKVVRSFSNVHCGETAVAVDVVHLDGDRIGGTKAPSHLVSTGGRKGIVKRNIRSARNRLASSNTEHLGVKATSDHASVEDIARTSNLEIIRSDAIKGSQMHGHLDGFHGGVGQRELNRISRLDGVDKGNV